MVRTPGTRRSRTHLRDGGSAWERWHLLFRDRLRHDSTDRDAYEQLEGEPARRERADVNHYAARERLDR